MQKDKHNIYSKEELLKLIKEGKNAPADMDEFDLEAMEGLKLLDNPPILNKLNKEVDEIIIQEKKKEKQRKAIYYFSAAASLLLIMSLIFLFKNEVVVKHEKVVAVAEKQKEENMQLDLTPPAEAATTYKAKQPEQQNAPKKETVLVKNKAKQKKETIGSENEKNLEQTTTINTKSKNAFLAKDENAERKEQAVAANQSVATNLGSPTIYQENAQQDESKKAEPDKAKEEAIRTQSGIVYESRDKNSDIAQAPAAPKLDAQKPEKKPNTQAFFATNMVKSKTTKSSTDPSFIGGDNAFAVYAKQNLKISSPENSGIIVVEFLIKKDGTVENIKVLKPLNNCDACSKDAVDLIKSIKTWKSATENGKSVSAIKKISVQYN